MFSTIVFFLSIALSVVAMVLTVFTIRRLKKEIETLRMLVELQEWALMKEKE